MKDNDIIEKLAAYEHNRWSRQINTNYIDLTENEKNSDRKEAIRIMEYIKDKVKYNE